MQRTSSCTWTQGILEMFASQGVDVARLVKAAGIDAARLEHPADVLQKRLASLGNARTSYRVSEEIIRRLHRGEPRREEIAASLALADRTLQRRLHAEGTSFQQLLDDARRELARKYLSEERYPLNQVADMLGFADQGNFFRACRRWLNEPPGQYRRRMASLTGKAAG